jgi:hypothetical protein
VFDEHAEPESRAVSGTRHKGAIQDFWALASGEVRISKVRRIDAIRHVVEKDMSKDHDKPP